MLKPRMTLIVIVAIVEQNSAKNVKKNSEKKITMVKGSLVIAVTEVVAIQNKCAILASVMWVLSAVHVKSATAMIVQMTLNMLNSFAMNVMIYIVRSVAMQSRERMELNDAITANRGGKGANMQMHFASAVVLSDQMLKFVRSVMNEFVSYVHILLVMNVKVLNTSAARVVGLILRLFFVKNVAPVHV